MIERLVYLTAAASMLAAGCVTELTPRGRQVEIAPLNVARACQRLGKVGISMKDNKGIDIRDAEHLMRNSAGAMGANVVRWDRIYSDRIEGTAFRCPPEGRRPDVALTARRSVP